MPVEPAARASRLRLWLGRLALAVAVPGAALLALEFGLRLAGFGRPADFLIRDEQPGYYRTNPHFADLFFPDSFDLRPLNFRVALRKPPGTVRIVVLGESAARGVPVPSFGFAPQLRAQLRARYPGKRFEVLDTGIVAIDSHVVYRIACDLARFQPDLYVVYAGNNEVVGPYGPGCAYLSAMPPLGVIRASVFVRSTRIGQLLGDLIGRFGPKGGRGVEWGGMSMFVDHAVAGDDPRLSAVYANFKSNLEDIVRVASGARAKVLLCTVVANLKDCPPFLSLHRAGLSPGDLRAWRAAFDEGRLAWRLGEGPRARARLEEARRLDPQYADTHFLLGSLDLRQGEIAAARREFVEALHWDALRFRPDPAINRAVREVARESPGEVTLVDAAAALGSDPASTVPPCGRELLFEHVHLDWPGNFLLGRMMAQACAAALFGDAGGETGWLDSAGCAAALAYTPHERPPMLLRVEVLIRKPPFTGQLTYVEDQARMAREIDAATRAAGTAACREEAAGVAAAALARDPDNPALAGILEGIDLDRGDAAAALGMARRAEAQLPRDFALTADEASLLMRLGRLDEADRLLQTAARSGADADLLAPVLVEFWSRSRRYGAGRVFLDAALARRPGDHVLRLARADLLRASGDGTGAERELRGVLADDPGNEDALESLVGLLLDAGRADAAASAVLAAADRQPENYRNNLRAAKICEARGDQAGAIRFMAAVERSGPVDATFELTLALKLYRSGRLSETIGHLAEARTLSLGEGNPAVTAAIGKLIGRIADEPAGSSRSE